MRSGFTKENQVLLRHGHAGPVALSFSLEMVLRFTLAWTNCHWMFLGAWGGGETCMLDFAMGTCSWKPVSNFSFS